jgi:hypothetical protein
MSPEIQHRTVEYAHKSNQTQAGTFHRENFVIRMDAMQPVVKMIISSHWAKQTERLNLRCITPLLSGRTVIKRKQNCPSTDLKTLPAVVVKMSLEKKFLPKLSALQCHDDTKKTHLDTFYPIHVQMLRHGSHPVSMCVPQEHAILCCKPQIKFCKSLHKITQMIFQQQNQNNNTSQIIKERRVFDNLLL